MASPPVLPDRVLPLRVMIPDTPDFRRTVAKLIYDTLFASEGFVGRTNARRFSGLMDRSYVHFHHAGMTGGLMFEVGEPSQKLIAVVERGAHGYCLLLCRRHKGTTVLATAHDVALDRIARVLTAKLARLDVQRR